MSEEHKEETVAEGKEPNEDLHIVKVSTTRSPFGYVDRCKHLLHEGLPEVELVGVAAAINSVASCVEILKSKKLVEVVKIHTSLAKMDGQQQTALPKFQVVMKKAPEFDAVYAEFLKEKAAKDAEKEAEKAEETTK
eukprot:NODE_2201_length_746_cov_118.691535_g1775_i0.p1 GENE.NODE_2201_length_746_cov_118.691535_g1775_i0~~NODE_2201_length_746_cov_118.691535_g1775_i0.p1  ORF type:complete len:136 (+),score=43.08 NODE_2201_length_746_cov_118.691535_g1775_i0:63-470(+)